MPVGLPVFRLLACETPYAAQKLRVGIAAAAPARMGQPTSGDLAPTVRVPIMDGRKTRFQNEFEILDAAFEPAVEPGHVRVFVSHPIDPFWRRPFLKRRRCAAQRIDVSVS